MFFIYIYNYNLDIGKKIELKDIVYIDSQISNMIILISYNLIFLKELGRVIFDENIFDFFIF